MGWPSAPDGWLGRLILERGLAGIYLIAFVVARNQFRALLGEKGLLPVPAFVERVPFRRAPSIFHFHYSDRFLGWVSWTGIALSTALLVGAATVVPLWASMAGWSLLWVLYLSIVNVGQRFYGFGWESLLLEAGFLAIFLGPSDMPPPSLVLWLFRWLVFRLEFGAGMIKLRGDRCWRDLTCLYYHHETQPMPNPLSRFFHHLPRPLHRIEVAANHLAQLVAAFGLFAPQPVASVSVVVIVVTQAWLVLSGNFSWLNVATIVLAFAAFEDGFLAPLLPVPTPLSPIAEPVWHQALVVLLVAAVAALSYWPARNLLSRRQLMNYSFNPLHLVNTYGAFGSITRIRHEIVIEATDDPTPGPDSEWKEYEFKGKPGDPRRRSPQVAPYHLRLDWLMWFVPLSPAYADEWFEALIVKLLEADPATLKLLRRAPFGDLRPSAIRALVYRYRFTDRAERRRTGLWWHREQVGTYMPPVSLPHDPGASRA